MNKFSKMVNNAAIKDAESAKHFDIILSDLAPFITDADAKNFERRYRMIFSNLQQNIPSGEYYETLFLIEIVQMAFQAAYQVVPSDKVILLKKTCIISILNHERPLNLFETGRQIGLSFIQIMEETETYNDHLIPEQIQLTLTFIEDHVYEPLTPKTVAENVHLSTRNLTSNLKKYVGLTLTESINFQRIREAKNLLRYSNLKVKEIAKLLHFYDDAHFSRTFHRLSGETPREYQKRMPFTQLIEGVMTKSRGKRN